MTVILNYSLLKKQLRSHLIQKEISFQILKKDDVSDGNTKSINLPIFCSLKKIDFGTILKGSMASVCKTIDEKSDNTNYRIPTDHEVLTTEFNFHYTLLHRSNQKSSKWPLNKDLVYSKETDSLWCCWGVNKKRITWPVSKFSMFKMVQNQWRNYGT